MFRANRFCFVSAATILLFTIQPLCAADPPSRPNVLFFIADDQNCRLPCYGETSIIAPNLDELAARGLTLRRAYCQTALCNPSRASFLTGLRPEHNGVVDNGGHFREHVPNAVTLPQFFKQNGYITVGLGKIFHPGYDDAASWSVPHWDPSSSSYGPAGQAFVERATAEADAKAAAGGKRPKHIFGPAWEAADCADNDLLDGETATKAIETLATFGDQPFFLTVGFLRPHLPLVAPKKYWDLYPSERMQTAANPRPPCGVPECALYDSTELRTYVGVPKSGPLSDDEARTALRAYSACTTFMDAQIGRVLDELVRLKHDRRTIVVFCGDHGWHLGDHGIWGKHTNFEQATRAPLLIALPDQSGAGGRPEALVEFIDIYPTLAELCGLPPPPGLDGRSFAELFDHVDAPGKSAVYSQYIRRLKDFGEVQGRAVRTERYRYVEWRLPEKNFFARELYDYRDDPQETVNRAALPEHAETVRELAELLRSETD